MTRDLFAMLHPGGTDSRALTAIAESFAGTHRVLTPDRRGHGRTPDSDGPMSFEGMADETIEVLEAQGVGRSPLLGYSDGAGLNFVDTADVYSQGESEEIVGEALAGGRRADVILATKFHGPMDVAMGQPGGDPNQRGNSRRWIVQEVENSLRRLQTDWIDLYQVHRPERETDVEETLSALTDLQRQGKIRAFGSSTFPAHATVEAQWVAQRRGLGRFVTEQPPYSILARGIEADLLPVTERYGMGVIPWSPLAGGWLSGRFRKGQDAPDSNRAKRMPARYDLDNPANRAKLDAAEDLAVLAEEAGLSLVHLAIAFVLAHPAVTAPIIGPRTMDQLETQLGAADVTLSSDVLDRIDEIVPPGVTLSRDDLGYVPPALADPFLRRRRTA